MKLFLVLMVLSFNAMGFSYPWTSQEAENLKIQADATKVTADAAAVNNTAQDLKLAKTKFVATDTITVATTIAASTTTSTDIVIPANSIITRFDLLIGGTAITSANDNTLAFFCETAADLQTAQDLTDKSINSYVAGVPQGTTTTWLASDGCTIKYVVGAGASGITAGIFTPIVEYFTKQ